MTLTRWIHNLMAFVSQRHAIHEQARQQPAAATERRPVPFSPHEP